jgi:hypothetical protein
MGAESGSRRRKARGGISSLFGKLGFRIVFAAFVGAVELEVDVLRVEVKGPGDEGGVDIEKKR